MAANRALEMQLQIRQDSEELGDFLKDLDKWEGSIKSKDEDLKTSKVINKKKLPPVRNQAKKKKAKKKKEEKKANKTNGTSKERISSYDYRSWDRLDVDTMITEIEDKEEMETLTSSEEGETDDEQLEEERRLQKALLEKDKGNDLFKVGRYEEAINCYTTAIQLDPSNAVFPANRAMALLKVNRYGAAEADCDLAIALDNTYAKAYLRRGRARQNMSKLQEALSDYQEVLKLEPNNKHAIQEIVTIHKKLGLEKQIPTDEEKSTKKKPLKRIFIEEIGSSDSEEETESGETQITAAKEELRPTLNHMDPKDTTKEKDCEPEKDTKTSHGEATKVLLTEEIRHPVSVNLESTENKYSSEGQKRTDIVTNNNKGAGAVKEAKAVPKITKKVYAVPKSSAQFQSDWRALQNKPEELFEYFKKIPPNSYPKLFQQSIDSDMLTRIIRIFHDYYIPSNLPVYNELKRLSEVKRFAMAVMFLSAQDKKVVNDLVSYAREYSSSTDGPSESELTALEKKYTT